MARSLPTSGSLSMLTIGNWFGQNASSSSTANSVRLGGTATPWTMNQVVFSATNSTTPSTNRRSIADYRGAKFAMFTNSTRSSVHGSSYSDFILGVFTCYFGIQNSSGTNSGMLYSYNRGYPITLYFTTTSGSLSNIIIRVRTGTSTTLQTLSVPFGASSVTFVGNYYYLSIMAAYEGAYWEGLVTAYPSYHGSYTASGYSLMGTGYHRMGIYLEWPMMSSSSDPFGEPGLEPIR